MLASLDFTLNLKSPKDRLFELITMYEKYPTFLPQQIREVKILENDFKKTITEETLYFKTFFKKEIKQKSIHTKISDHELHTKILEGPAKNSEIFTDFSEAIDGTTVKIKIKLHVSLKYKILVPVIKRWYKLMLTSVLYKMEALLNEVEKSEDVSK